MNNGNSDENTNPATVVEFTGGRLPVRTIVLTIIGMFSISNLTTEIPRIFTGGQVDYIGTALDVFMVNYSARNVLQQLGLDGGSANAAAAASEATSLAGLECCLTVNVGRDQNTWMEKEWAASGARLQFPIHIRFTDEVMDLGIPGEEGLGGRYCKRLDVINPSVSTFVGPNGQVQVPVLGGGWASLPIRERSPDGGGETKLRFFLDFPEGASRNDVSIPEGRVFFSGVAFVSVEGAPAELTLFEAPSGNAVNTDGGLTIKRNGIANLYGALGDINLILGRYRISAIKE